MMCKYVQYKKENVLYYFDFIIEGPTSMEVVHDIFDLLNFFRPS